MTIVKSEMLALSDNEKKAIELVLHICEGVRDEANDPNLLELADAVYENLLELQSDFVENPY